MRPSVTTRHHARCAAVFLGLLGVGLASAFTFPKHYYSPRNRERPTRPGTKYIILHTTEGAAAGSLRKLAANGEAHYMLDEKGKLYRILHRDKVAFHCGRSMWNGKTEIDTCSVGIEVVGTHCGSLTEAQYKALRSLIANVQKIYRIPDDRVLTHSMVAYATPNKWHKRSHRGRKRCGMLFASPVVRRRLGLTSQPSYDPDVRAGRLIEADTYLAARLFPRGSSSTSSTSSRKTAPTRSTAEEKGTEGVRTIGKDGTTAYSIAGEDYKKATTFYFFPDGQVKTGNALPQSTLNALPVGTRMLVGYTYGGHIAATRSAFDICGRRWNFPSTYYRFPDRSIRTGNNIKENAIPAGTSVYFQR